MATGRGVYKAHREAFLKIKKTWEPIDVEAESAMQLSGSVNRFNSELNRFTLKVINVDGVFKVFATVDKRRSK